MQPILEIQDLRVSFRMYDRGLAQRDLAVLSDLTLSVRPGEVVAVAGSSGSGKSLLASAILGLLPANATRTGEMRYKGEPLTPDRQKRLRGSEIALVPQSVQYLDPLMKVGPQADGHRSPRPVEKRRRLFSRLGLPEGTKLKKTVLEYCYKNDELGDPMVNDYHIAAMGWVSEADLKKIAEYSLRINELLTNYLKDLNIELIDFKLEFGKTADGTLVLADEISPDTCRFWDSVTHEKLDKDRFRRDLGGVEDAYHEILKRLMGE